jgi:hypothetical protein
MQVWDAKRGRDLLLVTFLKHLSHGSQVVKTIAMEGGGVLLKVLPNTAQPSFD